MLILGGKYEDTRSGSYCISLSSLKIYVFVLLCTFVILCYFETFVICILGLFYNGFNLIL
ncbi:hypothetical protein Hanom_Chr07g00595171 [Helianthus anomalus]